MPEGERAETQESGLAHRTAKRNGAQGISTRHTARASARNAVPSARSSMTEMPRRTPAHRPTGEHRRAEREDATSGDAAAAQPNGAYWYAVP